MNNDRADGIGKGKKILEGVWIRFPLKFIGKIFGPTAKTITYLFVGTVVILFIILSYLVGFGADWKTWTTDEVKQSPSLTYNSTPQPEPPKTPLQNVRGLNSYTKACQGESFDVILQLDDVWGKEKPFQVDPDDPRIISASESANAQVAKKYPYPCRPPWEVKLSFVPLKEQSIGVFIEYEDVFKVLLGDGDRQTWKIEKNDSARKSPWTEFIKEKLVNGKISVSKEVTIIISSNQKGNGLDLNIQFRYVPEGKNDYIWEERLVYIEAKATDLVGVPARPFRVGLNDSRFKGAGSEIRFGIFSIKEWK
ncbi:hypothetical protein HYW41_01290 [Candidatus Daviesbacteria bacterium]|nr:hypothetical protein [Candidatus Daviesbacteria bacterium]